MYSCTSFNTSGKVRYTTLLFSSPAVSCMFNISCTSLPPLKLALILPDKRAAHYQFLFFSIFAVLPCLIKAESLCQKFFPFCPKWDGFLGSHGTPQAGFIILLFQLCH